MFSWGREDCSGKEWVKIKLKNDNNHVIQKADRDNTIVILDKDS